jgi:hypothetical protein
VGASGSYTNSAKLFVPAGTLLQDSAGEILPPVHPKELNTCAWGIFLPLAILGLVSVNAAAVCAWAAQVITPVITAAANSAPHVRPNGLYFIAITPVVADSQIVRQVAVRPQCPAPPRAQSYDVCWSTTDAFVRYPSGSRN